MNPRDLLAGRAASNERTGMTGGRLSARMARLSIVGLLLLAVGATAASSSIDAYLPGGVGAPTAAQTSVYVESDDTAGLRFAVAGDVGTGEINAYRTGAVMDTLDEQRPYDALLLLGDNVYDNGPILLQRWMQCTPK